MTKEESLALKTEVKELLSKIALQLEKVPDVKEDEDYDGYGSRFEFDEDNDDLAYLQALKGYVTEAINAKSSYPLTKYEEQYYNSNCY